MKGTSRQTLVGYGFILPWIIALVVFIGYPFLAGFYFSFCDFPPLKSPLFIGLDNYSELLGDRFFHRSLGVTFIFAAFAIPIGVFFALTLAMFLNARVRGQSFYRVIFYIPHLVPTVVVAILWLWIFNPTYGLLNIVLKGVFTAADAWTGLFFNLACAAAGPGLLACLKDGGEALANCAYPTALALTGAPAIAWAAFGRPGRALGQVSPSAAGFLRFLAGGAILLALAAVLNVGLTWLVPADMAKLHSPGWLSDSSSFPAELPIAPSWALWGIIVMSLWGVGQMAVIYLAKLQDVPAELYEAADIDGANWWGKARHITLPMISPVILFNVVMAIIGTFQVFAEPYIMTQGGPEDKTRFVAMFVYDQAFLYQRVGYASAVAWVLFLIIVALTLFAFKVINKHVYYAGR